MHSIVETSSVQVVTSPIKIETGLNDDGQPTTRLSVVGGFVDFVDQRNILCLLNELGFHSDELQKMREAAL